MKSNFIKILFFVGLVTLVSSCYYDSQDELYPLVSQAKCDTTNAAYSGQVSAIVATNCLMCHSTAASTSTGGGIILESYDNLSFYALNGSLVNSINGTGGKALMPKNGAKMSSCDIAIIEKWVNDGSLNN